jgi:hypothetical protein
MIAETWVVTFENPEHKQYVDLLQEYGFDITVTSSLKVGLDFRHPKKHHIVRLDIDDERNRGQIYEPHFFVHKAAFVHNKGVNMADYDTPMFPSHYSQIEWNWLTQDDASLFEVLRRELHIWFKVRPHSMNNSAQIG